MEDGRNRPGLAGKPSLDPERESPGGLSPALVFSHIRPWLDYLLAVRGLSLATVTAYDEDMRDFCSFVQELACPSENHTNRPDMAGTGTETLPAAMNVGEETILLYLSWGYSRGLEARTQARRLAALRSFFGYLVEQGLAGENPTEKNRNPKLPRHLPTFLSVSEV